MRDGPRWSRQGGSAADNRRLIVAAALPLRQLRRAADRSQASRSACRIPSAENLTLVRFPHRWMRRAYKLAPTGNQGVRSRATSPTTPVSSPPPDSLRFGFPPTAGGRLHNGPLRETPGLGLRDHELSNLGGSRYHASASNAPPFDSFAASHPLHHPAFARRKRLAEPPVGARRRGSGKTSRNEAVRLSARQSPRSPDHTSLTCCLRAMCESVGQPRGVRVRME